MQDNWSFVVAAYLLAFIVLVGYWRRLVRRDRQLRTRESRRKAPAHP